jgi:diaminopimelate epimerase
MADFYKYHGLGNDYLVIDPKQISFSLNLTEENIKLICHRNYGVGSDGILYGPIMDGAKITFRIFNPDGSEAEKSGNGIRIFALYALDLSYVTEKHFDLYTKAGKVSIELIDAKTNMIKVGMGEYSFMNNKIPALLGDGEVVDREIEVLGTGSRERISCVNIGNPHCVLIKEGATEELARKLGPALENHPLFPNRINVQIVEVLDRSNIKIEIWERGAGYTLASGTSSAAAACVSHKLGFVDKDVTVHMPGGTMQVEIAGKNMHLTGEVARVMEGNFAQDLKNKLIN